MRFRIAGGAVMAFALALVCAPLAHADNYPIRDGTGATQTFASKLVGGLQYPIHLVYGLFGTTPKAIAVDNNGSVNVNVSTSTLPAGAATAANQTSSNSKLDQVHTDLTTGVTIGASALPSGAATAANQVTANSSLSSIDTKLSSQATAANQSAANTKLDAISSSTGADATNNAAFSGAVAMTVGTTYSAQRSLAAVCSAAGNVSLTFSDSSTLSVPVVVGWNQFPFAITAVNSGGTTATCTYSNLK